MGEINGVKWVDVPYTPIISKGEPRKNVFVSESETEYLKTKEKCDRKWSFTRKDEI